MASPRCGARLIHGSYMDSSRGLSVVEGEAAGHQKRLIEAKMRPLSFFTGGTEIRAPRLRGGRALRAPLLTPFTWGSGRQRGHGDLSPKER